MGSSIREHAIDDLFDFTTHPNTNVGSDRQTRDPSIKSARTNPADLAVLTKVFQDSSSYRLWEQFFGEAPRVTWSRFRNAMLRSHPFLERAQAEEWGTLKAIFDPTGSDTVARKSWEFVGRHWKDPLQKDPRGSLPPKRHPTQQHTSVHPTPPPGTPATWRLGTQRGVIRAERTLCRLQYSRKKWALLILQRLLRPSKSVSYDSEATQLEVEDTEIERHAPLYSTPLRHIPSQPVPRIHQPVYWSLATENGISNEQRLVRAALRASALSTLESRLSLHRGFAAIQAYCLRHKRLIVHQKTHTRHETIQPKAQPRLSPSSVTLFVRTLSRVAKRRSNDAFRHWKAYSQRVYNEVVRLANLFKVLDRRICLNRFGRWRTKSLKIELESKLIRSQVYCALQVFRAASNQLAHKLDRLVYDRKRSVFDTLLRRTNHAAAVRRAVLTLSICVHKYNGRCSRRMVAQRFNALMTFCLRSKERERMAHVARCLSHASSLFLVVRTAVDAYRRRMLNSFFATLRLPKRLVPICRLVYFRHLRKAYFIWRMKVWSQHLTRVVSMHRMAYFSKTIALRHKNRFLIRWKTQCEQFSRQSKTVRALWGLLSAHSMQLQREAFRCLKQCRPLSRDPTATLRLQNYLRRRLFSIEGQALTKWRHHTCLVKQSQHIQTLRTRYLIRVCRSRSELHVRTLWQRWRRCVSIPLVDLTEDIAAVEKERYMLRTIALRLYRIACCRQARFLRILTDLRLSSKTQRSSLSALADKKRKLILKDVLSKWYSKCLQFQLHLLTSYRRQQGCKKLLDICMAFESRLSHRYVFVWNHVIWHLKRQDRALHRVLKSSQYRLNRFMVDRLRETMDRLRKKSVNQRKRQVGYASEQLRSRQLSMANLILRRLIERSLGQFKRRLLTRWQLRHALDEHEWFSHSSSSPSTSLNGGDVSIILRRLYRQYASSRR
eukprot:GILJ01012728.1.p1 GENE.GILJ01012728.1~~GILJ01012728.1.p1  ORF type:complete len:1010 (+),score=65.04 GILJ01012728.1:196-3030(+)